MAPPMNFPFVSGVVVLDFDQTLTAFEMHPHHLASSPATIFGGQERLDALQQWLVALREKGGVLGVVSRNARGVVKSALDSAGLAPFFDERVYGTEDVEYYSMWHGRKSRCIRRRLMDPMCLLGVDVIFVDDDRRSCAEVEENLGASTVWVDAKKGISDEHMARVSEWLAARREVAPPEGFANHRSRVHRGPLARAMMRLEFPLTLMRHQRAREQSQAEQKEDAAASSTQPPATRRARSALPGLLA